MNVFLFLVLVAPPLNLPLLKSILGIDHRCLQSNIDAKGHLLGPNLDGDENIVIDSKQRMWKNLKKKNPDKR